MDARYFASERNKKSLDLKNAKPWEIIQNINNKVYKLKILQTLKDVGFTPIFHSWKMHLTSNNSFPGQILPLDPPIKISTKDDKDHKAYEKWEMLEIINCYQIKCYKVQYKATYVNN